MPWSRRRILAALVSGLGVPFAGCETGDDPEPIPDAADAPRPVEAYESVRVRNTDGAVLYTRRDAVPTNAADVDRVRRGSDYLVTRESFEELTFGSVSEATELRSFVDATDFETQSVYLFATGLDACHEIRLSAIERDPDGDPHGEFCQARRPADVACSLEDVDSVAVAVRLPFSAAVSSGHGTGMARSCRGPSEPVPFTADVVARNGSENS